VVTVVLPESLVVYRARQSGHTEPLQIFTGLLRDDEILHARQQRLLLAQVHAQRFHRQFPRFTSRR
jgi:hypothetical protein